jgi:photosystem II stability/assembly factor-like uncharacterized protein
MIVYSDDGSAFHQAATNSNATLYAIWGSGSTVYAVGEKGLVLRSSDGGHNFAPVSVGVTSDLHAVWGSGATVFVAGDSTVLLRGDAGSWTALTSPAMYGNWRALWGRSASDVWLAGDGNTVYHAADGKTFTSAGAAGATSSVAYLTGDASNIYTLGETTYARFDGKSWVSHAVTPNPGVAYTFSGIWGAASNNVFVVGSDNLTSEYLYQSADDFASIPGDVAPASPPLGGALWGAGQTAYAVGGATLVHTVDGAKTWQQSIHGDVVRHTAIWASDEQHMFVAGDGGHVWSSSDGGVSWSPLATNTTKDLQNIVGRSDGTVIAGGGSDGSSVLVRSRDFGAHWESPAGGAPVCNGLALTNDALFAVDTYECYVWRSTDLGDHWTMVNLPPANTCAAISTVWASGSTVIGTSVNQPTWWSSDGGMSFKQSQLPAGTSISAVWGSDGSHIWGVGLSGTVLRSSDGGMTFQQLPAPTTQHFQTITGRSADDIFAAAWDQVFRTRDGGQTWVALPSLPYPEALWASGQHLFAVGGGGEIARLSR